MTPVGHLLTGYLVGEWAASGGSERWWVIGAALAGSIAPDFDVALGLLGGWAGSSAHRGATHSFLGAVVMAWAIAAVLRRPRGRLFLAALGGILTHIFWDWLNPWGVRPLWPGTASFRGNLLHEGDLYATAIVLGVSVLVWRKRGHAAVAVLVTVLPAYLGVQLWWRDHARGLARAELAERRFAVYPTDQIRCGWIVLSAGEGDMRVHCVATPAADHLRPAFQAPVRSDFFTRASEQSAVVRELRRKIPFPFAQVEPVEEGGAVVVWRDLRIAYRESPANRPTGIHVRVDATGRILDERHYWWLTWW